MKKMLVLTAIALSVFAVSCKKEGANAPITQPSNTAAKGFWSVIWEGVKAVFGLGPSVHVTYRDGYYESKGEQIHQFKCNPGKAICEFTVHAGKGAPVPVQGFGEAEIGINRDNKLVVAIARASLTDVDYANNFESGLFTVPNDWKISDEVRIALGLPTNHIVPSGNYPINNVTVEGESFLVITFN